MKATTILTTIAALSVAANVLGQSQIGVGTVIGASQASGLKAPVYKLETSDATLQKFGNTSAGIPAGSQTYSGGLVDATYKFEIWYTPNQQLVNQSPRTFDDIAPITTFATNGVFRTGAVFGGTFALGEIYLPGTAPRGSATVQVRAYAGTYQGSPVLSWADVVNNPMIPHGWSVFVPVPSLGGTPPGEPSVTPPILAGLTSFNLFQVPEPSVIALGVLGLGALVLFRRRRN